jgi:hypothetical protein
MRPRGVWFPFVADAGMDSAGECVHFGLRNPAKPFDSID